MYDYIYIYNIYMYMYVYIYMERHICTGHKSMIAIDIQP